MKKKLHFILLICVVLLTGCLKPETTTDKSDFYYVRDAYIYSGEKSVLSAERRKVTGDMTEILNIYLRGPKHRGLISPFPEGVYVASLELEDRCLKVDLGRNFASLSGIDVTVACSALTNTCLGLCDFDTIVISAGGALLNGQPLLKFGKDAIITTDDTPVEKEAA